MFDWMRKNIIEMSKRLSMHHQDVILDDGEYSQLWEFLTSEDAEAVVKKFRESVERVAKICNDGVTDPYIIVSLIDSTFSALEKTLSYPVKLRFKIIRKSGLRDIFDCVLELSIGGESGYWHCRVRRKRKDMTFRVDTCYAKGFRIGKYKV